MFIFLLSILIINIFSNVFGDLYHDAEMYMNCRGKPTGLRSLFTSETTAIAPCLTYSRKYCRMLCAAQKLGVIDSETGKIDDDQSYKLYSAYGNSMDPAIKKQVHTAVKDCARGQILQHVEGCESTRKLMYCVHNKYTKICKIDKPDKNLKIQSTEEGIAGEAIGVIGGQLEENI